MTLREFISAERISTRVAEMAREVAGALPDPVVIGVLNGAAPFMMELLARLPAEAASRVQYDFVDATSYRGTESTGTVELTHRGAVDLRDRRVLIADGIVDTGATLRAVVDDVTARGAAEVRTCVLLDKPSRRRVDVPVDYRGFEVEDLFVVGYGMDLDGRFRGLRHIAVIEG